MDDAPPVVPTPRVKAVASKPNVGAFAPTAPTAPGRPGRPSPPKTKKTTMPLAVGDADGWIPRKAPPAPTPRPAPTPGSAPPPRTPAAKKSPPRQRTPVRDDDPCKTCGARPPSVVFGRFATSGARKATCEPCLAKQRSAKQKPPPPPPSIAQMKDAIARAGLGVADLLERSDVEARYREALARLPRADADADADFAPPKKRRRGAANKKMSASARADALAALEAACRRVPTRRPTPSAVAVPTTALLILPEWLTPIMTGEKTVELRAISSLKRGVRIGFCASGTGRCWGEATFLHCEGPLDDARLAALQDAHGVRAPEGAADAGAAIRTALNWNKVYAWHLTAAAPYESPLPYVHPSGAITWVDLPAAVAAVTATALDPAACEGQAPPATDAWACSQCTLLNAPAAAACSACDASRPRATAAATPEGYDVDSDSSGPPRPRAAVPAVGDRVVLRLDDVEGVVSARGRPGWFMVDLNGYDAPIEFQASELRVLSPADASDSDDDRPIEEPFGNAPRAAGRFDEFAFREASAPPRSPRPEAVPESVGAMRSLIASAGLSSADCVEKSELRARSVVALERLAEAKRLRDARNE